MHDPIPGPGGPNTSGGIIGKAVAEALARIAEGLDTQSPDPEADNEIRDAQPETSSGGTPDSSAEAEVHSHRGGPRYE